MLKKALFHGNITKKIFSLFCVVAVTFFYVRNAYSLSIEEEKALGQKFVSQIYRYFDLVNDEFCVKYINDLGQYLIRGLPSRPFPFHFYIVKDKSLNAFAAPGGYVFVFSGLINAADRVDELASVMCHECGHVSARHISKRIEQGKQLGMMTLASLLLGILIGGDAGSALINSSMAASMQAQLHYSRNDERQADQIGFTLLGKSGFDAYATVEIMKKLENGTLFSTNKIPPYLLTHPTGPERVAYLQAMLSRYVQPSPSKEVKHFRAMFPFFKTIVIAKSLDPDDAIKYFERQQIHEDKKSFSCLGIGIAYMRLANYTAAIKNLKQARKLNPDAIPILTTLSEAYEYYGQNLKALKLLQYAHTLNDEDDSVTFLLGKAYENMGEYEKAIRLFERLASFKPVNNDVYYNLGICYGRSKKLALAHYNFGLYFMNIYDTKKAEFHFKRAKILAKNNPVLQEKIKEQQDIIKGKKPQPRHHHEWNEQKNKKQGIAPSVTIGML